MTWTDEQRLEIIRQWKELVLVTKNELQSHLSEVDTWNDPKNDEAREAFLETMCGRGSRYQYGKGPTEQAWAWFLQGWTMGINEVLD